MNGFLYYALWGVALGSLAVLLVWLWLVACDGPDAPGLRDCLPFFALFAIIGLAVGVIAWDVQRSFTPEKVAERERLRTIGEHVGTHPDGTKVFRVANPHDGGWHVYAIKPEVSK